MFISEIWLFDWYFPQFCKSDMSKYGYLEVFQRVPSTSRKRESTVFLKFSFLKPSYNIKENFLTGNMKLNYSVVTLEQIGKLQIGNGIYRQGLQLVDLG